MRIYAFILALLATAYFLLFGLGPWLIPYPINLAPLMLFVSEIVVALIAVQILIVWLLIRRRVAHWVLGLNRWWAPFALEIAAAIFLILLVPAFKGSASRDVRRLQEVASYFFGIKRSYIPQDMEAEYRLRDILSHLHRGEFEEASASLEVHALAKPPRAVPNRSWKQPGHRLEARQLRRAIQARAQMAAYLREQAEIAGLNQSNQDSRLLRIAYFLEIIEPGNDVSAQTVALYRDLELQIEERFRRCRTQELSQFAEDISEFVVAHLGTTEDIGPYRYERGNCEDLQQRLMYIWESNYMSIPWRELEQLIALNESRIERGQWTTRGFEHHPYRAIGTGALRELWLEWTSDMNITRRHCPRSLLGESWAYARDLGITYWQCDDYGDAIR